MKAAVQLLKQTEDLKAKASGDILKDNEVWTCHQKLRDLYHQLLILDLEYALDKKVEQELWNYVFKNQINVLQNQAKDKKNANRTESQGHLTWFLDVASGFYLQLLQELCETFNLDLPCWRKGSIYGIIKEPKSSSNKITLPQKSSCLYVCQHCLVHLGDIARYRNQSLQAETFYRHAAQLVPSNGQPYNQLAILEAAKGEKLTTIFYYVRSIGVKYPFPVAATNLQKLFAKISNDELCIEGKAKVSVYDYISTFLQFHSLIHMVSDFDKADKLLRVLASNLSTLVATESLSSHKLIQMTAINLFALSNLSKKNNTFSSDKSDYVNETLSKEECKAYNYMLELLASMLNGLLLLVYTMKAEEHLHNYYALPIIKLILDWVKQDLDVLNSHPFSQKLQVWPSLCKLLNGIQHGLLGNFDGSRYKDVPLPEDWDLQCFLPLNKSHKQYKFKETNRRLTEDEEVNLRAYRLICHGQWICEQEITGMKLMTLQTSGDTDLLTFEAIIQQSPSTDILLQLEEVSVSKANHNGHSPSDYDNCNVSIASEDIHIEDMKLNMNLNHKDHLLMKGNDKTNWDKNSKNINREKTNRLDNKSLSINEDRNLDKSIEKDGCDRKENNHLENFTREKKSRQNVAMQTIMQKKNVFSKNDLDDTSNVTKCKIETTKQVTFKTPSPSPPASSEGTPPQIATPQPSNSQHSDLSNNYCSLQPIYSQIQQNSPGNYMSLKPTFPVQNPSKSNVLSPSQNFPTNRVIYSALPTAGTAYQNSFNPQNVQTGEAYTLSNFRNQLKDSILLPQTGSYSGNRLNNIATNLVQAIPPPPQQFVYNIPAGPNPSINPAQQKQNFSVNENPVFGQHIQWYSTTPVPNQSNGIHHLQSVKGGTLEHLHPQNQQRLNHSSSQMELPSPGSTSLPPNHSQTFSPGTYQIFTNSPPGPHPASQQRPALHDNLVYQMQSTPVQIPYSFQSAIPPRLTQNALSTHAMNSPLPKLATEQQFPLISNKMQASTRMDIDQVSATNDAITNTYSLFNSPWSSGLNLSPTAAKEGVCLSANTAPPAVTNLGNLMQAGMQSFWSGPGPSPLERLLEQQKQKRDAAPQ